MMGVYISAGEHKCTQTHWLTVLYSLPERSPWHHGNSSRGKRRWTKNRIRLFSLCRLLSSLGGVEQTVSMQRVTRARHLPDQVTGHSFHFGALHLVQMQTPCSKLQLCSPPPPHHMDTTISVNSAPSTWTQTALKWEGDKEFLSPDLELGLHCLSCSFIRRSLRLNQICLKTPLNLGHGQGSRAWKVYRSSNRTGHWIRSRRTAGEGYDVLSGKTRCTLEKGGKKTPLGLTLPNTINFGCSANWMSWR